jgi:hypothetical protein
MKTYYPIDDDLLSVEGRRHRQAGGSGRAPQKTAQICSLFPTKNKRSPLPGIAPLILFRSPQITF